VQYRVIHVISLEPGSQSGRGPNRTITGIPSGGGKAVAKLVTSVYDLIPKQRSPTRTPVGIQQIHGSRPQDDPPDQLSLVFHESSCS
jgi:hypothetical protein